MKFKIFFSFSSFLTKSFLGLLMETDFLIKRQVAWEDSFRSLYYMLRKNICNIFYGKLPSSMLHGSFQFNVSSCKISYLAHMELHADNFFDPI